MKNKTLEQFESTHGQSKIDALQQRLNEERAKVEALSEDRRQSVDIQKSDSTTIRFGLTGDRHFGSLYAAPEYLKAFYDYAEGEGVKVVYDAGDMVDGHKIYRGQEFELSDLGVEAQVARMLKNSPQNIETRFITGNHDASFKHLAGVGVGGMIQEKVPNHVFLGEEQGDVCFETPNGNFVLRLLHPGGGSSYALSYKSQKIIESLEGGTKPDMIAIGHFHKAFQMPSYRNVACFQTGTFQKQTPFMARHGLAAHVGGWIVEVNVGVKFNTIRGEFVAFYE